MGSFLDAVVSALPGAVISFVVSGLFLYYLRWYIDKKLKEEEQIRETEKHRKIEQAKLEMRRRRAIGRLFFWLHRAVVCPPPNGELEDAMEAFQAIEEEQKMLDQTILAQVESGGSA